MASVRSLREFEGPTRPPSQADSEYEHRAPPRRVKRQPPQRNIDDFWTKFTTKTPGKAFTILPDNLYAKRRAQWAPKGAIPGTNAIDPYEEAVRICKAKVEKISRECRRVNQKYRDPHFDIEFDFSRLQTAKQQGKARHSDCLMGLVDTECNLQPQSVKRVEDIFDAPRFYIDKATANDVRQGNDGNCWFMSALSTLSNKEGLIEKVCVAQDVAVGVYGFVFHRDGEWISEVIDDKLYLCKPDYSDDTLEQELWLRVDHRKNPEEEYRSVMQRGSRALYFAQCSDENETWLPLLEKAYAKAHGDFSAIEGGFVGEGIEDLTGGVTTEFFTTDILDKDQFWREELMNVNKSFLFGCGSTAKGANGQIKGIVEKHAYSVMEAVEVDGQRLLKLRNPWGKTEWSGPWSDGSEEWTPDWMIKLNHKFGNDGVFWISYPDLLRNYQHFDRTRLFGDEWTVTQQWTSLNIPWSVDYHDTKFRITLTKKSPVVIVLSQLDERYFRGLEGQYEFQLSFRLHKDKDNDDDYIVRSHGNYFMRRSVSVELDLEAGNYSVLLKIIAKRFPKKETAEDAVRRTCGTRREKLLRIGLSYDLAHAKGQFKDYELEKQKQEKAKRKAEHKAKREAERRRLKKAKSRKKAREEKALQKKLRKAAAGQEKTDPNLAFAQDQIRGLGIDDPTQSELQTVEVRIVRASQSSSQSRPRSLSREHKRRASGDGTFGGRGGYNASPSKLQQVSTPQDLGILNEDVSRGGYNDSPKLVGQDPVSEGDGGFGGGRGGYNATMSPPRTISLTSLPQALIDEQSMRAGINDSPGLHDPRFSSGLEGSFGGRGGYNASPGEGPEILRREDHPAEGEGGGGYRGRGGYNTGRGGYNVPPDEVTAERPVTHTRGSLDHGGSSRPHTSAGNKAIPSSATPRLQVNGADARSPVTDSDESEDDSSLDSELDDSDDGNDDAGDQYDGYSDDDEFARDPWNAVCVVGLRVYSQDKQVKIEVVRPEGEKHEGKLDVDDAAADATRLRRKRSTSQVRNMSLGGHPAFVEGSYQG